MTRWLYVGEAVFLWLVLTTASTLANSREKRSLFGTSKICMDELGCFSNGGKFFHIMYRPLSPLPSKREHINTKFLFYTRANEKECETIPWNSTVDEIKNTKFDGSKPTKFIVHGFIDSQFAGEWMQDLKNDFLAEEDSNVIIVNWEGGNQPPYSQASSNTRVVGAEIALLINKLIKHSGANPRNIHLNGHSLGAHVCGYAGLRVQNIGRITGLDPAQPLFQGMHHTVRLDQSDARFVDVIHSDGTLVTGYGMTIPVGHVDFYPNNGRKQPGCGTVGRIKSLFTQNVMSSFRTISSCNHQRSIDYLHDSANNADCTMVGYQCPNYETFLNGKCGTCGDDGSKCAILGREAVKYKAFARPGRFRKMFLRTHSKAPFCLHHYQVTVKTSEHWDSSPVSARMQIFIQGSNTTAHFHLKQQSEEISPGMSYTYLAVTTENVGKIEKIKFKWERPATSFTLWRKLPLESVTLYYMNVVTDASTRSQYETKMCSSSKDGVIAGKKYSLCQCQK